MTTQKFDIIDTTYHLHSEPDGSSVVEIRYAVKIRDGVRLRSFSEYLNFEDKKLREAAIRWWQEHSHDPIPAKNQHAVDIANYHGVHILQAIEVEYTGTSYEITNVIIKEKAKKLEETW